MQVPLYLAAHPIACIAMSPTMQGYATYYAAHLAAGTDAFH